MIIEGGNIQSNTRGLIVFNKRCLLKNNNQSWHDIKPYFDKAINNNNIKIINLSSELLWKTSTRDKLKFDNLHSFMWLMKQDRKNLKRKIRSFKS